MIELLAKRFIRQHEKTDDPGVRRAYGVLCGAVGIFLNLLLFAAKLIAGALSGSIAITADAFNNLSDGASSLVTIIGFRLAGQKPDTEHPFGHGRFEYISGMVVAMAIVVMGAELFLSSCEKILHPEPTEASAAIYAILVMAVLVKLYMALYNRRIGRKINSAAIAATAADSTSDAVATTVVLLATVTSDIWGLAIDGWCGILVALFITWAGINAARDTIRPLLGEAPDDELVKKIYERVMENPEIIGMHDLVIHDYGPGRLMLSLHAEVSSHDDLIALHDVIDNVERKLAEEFACEAVIHMDPVDSDDEHTNHLRAQMAELVRSVDEHITIHDFRVVSGPSHTNVIFDVVVPYSLPWNDEEIESKIRHLVRGLDGEYFAVVKVDRDYTSYSVKK